MRLLLIHAEEFYYKARKKAVAEPEELTEENSERKTSNTLVVFTTVEEDDSKNPNVVVIKAANEILDVYNKLGAGSITIYPYSHLSSNLAPPSVALSILKQLEEELKSRISNVYRAPFGWYKEFTLSCYGHPLSELSKKIEAKERVERREKERREYYILTLEGDLVKPEEYTFKDGERGFMNLVYKEAFKKELEGGESKVHSYCKKFGFEWESSSDQGHMRYGPEASLMMDLVSEYSWNIARSLGVPVFQVKGTNMFDLSVKAVREHAELFGDRLYVIPVGSKKYVMRYAACHQQFSMLKDWIISYKDLPFGVFEVADSYRLEQPGEIVLCFRMRKFYMPDLHILTRDVEEAKKITLKIHEKIYEEIRKMGRDYVSIYNTTRSFFEENKEYFMELLKMEGKPVLVVFYPEGKYYWVINVEFNIIDELGRPREIGTFQIDLGNAKRFGIYYVDERGAKHNPVIIHTAIIGSIERYIYALLDTAALMERRGEKPYLPVWISPIQVRLLPVSKEYVEYCMGIAEKIESYGIRVDIDDRDISLAKKIRDAETSWIPYICIIGRKEVEAGRLSVNIRHLGVKTTMGLNELMERILEEIKGYPRKTSYLPVLLSKRPVYKP